MKQFFNLILILFLASCGKKDLSTNQTISGNVRNNCTGTGFADVKVNFITIKKKAFGKTESHAVSTKTDADGNFSFITDVDKSGKHSYAIDIPGYSNYDTEFYGIMADIEPENLSRFHQFGVSASYKSLYLNLPQGITINSPDSFFISMHQNTLHFYEPERVWKINYSSFNGISSANNNINYSGGYPMGWWQITLDKTKGGVHSVMQDSIYLGMGASATYTIPW